MTKILNKIVDLKHWQIFLLIVVPLMLPPIHPIVNKVLSIFSFLFMLIWFYAIVQVLNDKILKEKYPKSGYFKYSILLMSLILVSLAFTPEGGIHITNSNYKEFGIWLWPIVVLIIYCMWQFLYFFYCCSKVISSAHMQVYDTKESISLNYFFAFWFYIIGIWYVQPKIHELLDAQKAQRNAPPRTDFYGNMGEPTTAEEYKRKYGVYPPNYDANGNRIKD